MGYILYSGATCSRSTDPGVHELRLSGGLGASFVIGQQTLKIA